MSEETAACTRTGLCKAPFRPVSFSFGAYFGAMMAGAQVLPYMMMTVTNAAPSQPTTLSYVLGPGLTASLVVALFLFPQLIPKVALTALIAPIIAGLAISPFKGMFFDGLAVLFFIQGIIFIGAMLACLVFLPVAFFVIHAANLLKSDHVGTFALLGALSGAAIPCFLIGSRLFDRSSGNALSLIVASCGAGCVAGMTYRWLQLRFPQEVTA